MTSLRAQSRGPGASRQEPQRLARGVLTTFDIAAATLANIAPAMSFFFVANPALPVYKLGDRVSSIVAAN